MLWSAVHLHATPFDTLRAIAAGPVCVVVPGSLLLLRSVSDRAVDSTSKCCLSQDWISTFSHCFCPVATTYPQLRPTPWVEISRVLIGTFPSLFGRELGQSRYCREVPGYLRGTGYRRRRSRQKTKTGDRLTKCLILNTGIFCSAAENAGMKTKYREPAESTGCNAPENDFTSPI